MQQPFAVLVTALERPSLLVHSFHGVQVLRSYRLYGLDIVGFIIVRRGFREETSGNGRRIARHGLHVYALRVEQLHQKIVGTLY